MVADGCLFVVGGNIEKAENLNGFQLLYRKKNSLPYIATKIGACLEIFQVITAEARFSSLHIRSKIGATFSSLYSNQNWCKFGEFSVYN